MAAKRRQKETETSPYFTTESEISAALGTISLRSAKRQIKVACGEGTWPPLSRLPKPKFGDWLASNKELGQSFDEYEFEMSAAGRVPSSSTNTILLVPFGPSFNCEIGAAFLTRLAEFCKAFFFGMNVEVAKQPLPLEGVHSRTNQFGHPQYLIGDMFDRLKGVKRFKGVYSKIGITLEDIYPNDEFTYVFGQALASRRIGVFSFARHSPVFYSHGLHASEAGHILTPVQKRSWQRYCIRTLMHEIGHCFNLRHCIYYQCLMNGTNGPGESAAQSNFLCPVCLRKLLRALSFASGVTPVDRYSAMLEVTNSMRNDWGNQDCIETPAPKDSDAAWLEARIALLNDQLLENASATSRPFSLASSKRRKSTVANAQSAEAAAVVPSPPTEAQPSRSASGGRSARVIAQQQDQAPEAQTASKTEQDGVHEEPKLSVAREPEPNATGAEIPDGEIESAQDGVNKEPKLSETREPEPNATAAEIPDGEIESTQGRVELV